MFNNNSGEKIENKEIKKEDLLETRLFYRLADLDEKSVSNYEKRIPSNLAANWAKLKEEVKMTVVLINNMPVEEVRAIYEEGKTFKGPMFGIHKFLDALAFLRDMDDAKYSFYKRLSEDD
ncbi:MAG: hypothetical protein UV36_C0014G0007 [Parcubacteria group bacterium GW2011_GWC2_42_6]|nr:MAG: hypothetical protein UU87_C0002G0139 [Parcubacteria group bacterium GW2011_GWA2_42_11]KKS66986.1 MAG: hypothetical protein UV36_C0014G0007 [Parcubacteria group bacterium GW2011_GWC2_42_6]